MNDKYRMLTKIVRNMNLKQNALGEELNSNEAESLRFISKYNGCIANDIVNYLNVDKGLMTRIIKKLELKGYITINDGMDKRKKHLCITEEGLKYKSNTQQFETSYYKSLFENIDLDEQEAFFKTLEKVYIESKKLRKLGNEKKIR